MTDMQIWCNQAEVERAWIKAGKAGKPVTDNIAEDVAYWSLYTTPKEEVIKDIFRSLKKHVAYTTLWLAGVLQIAAETTVPDGVSVREHKRKLFDEIYASEEDRNRILNIAATQMFDVLYREDRYDIRRHLYIKNSKLNGQQAKDIRQKFRRGMAAELAAEYGISQRAVYNIVNRATWKFV